MAIKPILFNTAMVRAILLGRKTETRRLIKPKYRDDEYGFQVVHNDDWSHWYVEKMDEYEGGFDDTRYIRPPYLTGDILYVRETWYYESHMEDQTAGEPDLPSGRYSHRYVFKADCPDFPVDVGVGKHGWKPSIHMPKEAARIFLRVTDVRVERLQQITEEGAEKEGFVETYVLEGDTKPTYMARDAFRIMWGKTIRETESETYGWDADPWVWVIEFERCENPEKGVTA